mgnify:CR=1 FL=1
MQILCFELVELDVAAEKAREFQEEIRKFAETSPLNRVEEGDPKVGVISSGISYEYARDAFPEATFLKLGMSFPFPIEMATEFCSRFETVYVVEENEPFIEEHLRYSGVTNIIGKDRVPLCRSSSPSRICRRLRARAPQRWIWISTSSQSR